MCFPLLNTVVIRHFLGDQTAYGLRKHWEISVCVDLISTPIRTHMAQRTGGKGNYSVGDCINRTNPSSQESSQTFVNICGVLQNYLVINFSRTIEWSTRTTCICRVIPLLYEHLLELEFYTINDLIPTFQK